MKHNFLKKGIAGLLSAVMTMSMAMPAQYQVQAGTTDNGNLLVHYDMSHSNGYLTDLSGKGNDAKLNNLGDENFAQRLNDAVLELPGKSEAYVTLPASIAKGLDYNKGFSVEMTFVPKNAANQFLWTLGTGNSTDYLFFNPIRPYGSPFVGIKTENGQKDTDEKSVERGVNADVKLDTKAYSTVTVTSAGNELKFYINGKLGGTLEHDRDLSAIFEGHEDGVLGYIAKSNWPWDPYCEATVTDFKMYSSTLSADEVKKNYEAMNDLQKMYEDAESVTIPEYTFDDLTLPTTTKNGTTVTWSTSNAEVMEKDGTIHATGKDVKVTLTAVFSTAKGNTVTKTYDVIVVAAGDMGKLEFLSGKFELGISYITEDIILANEFNGVKIEWSANDLIAADGTVTRPQKDTKIALKATFSYAGTSKEKEFSVTVAGKTAGYLATFVAAYEENMGLEYGEKTLWDDFKETDTTYSDNPRTDVMHYALSEDGKEYTALNNSKGVLYPEDMYQMGSPSLFRTPNGAYGAIASVNNDSAEILVYESEDLIFFENQKKVELNQQNIVVKNPMVKYNNGTMLYEIYWEGGDGKSYVTETEDFTSFSDPKETNYAKQTVTGKLPAYAAVEESAQFELTAEEYDRIEKKFGEIHSTSVDGTVQVSAGNTTKEHTFSWTADLDNTLNVSKDSDVTLPSQVQVQYNDGSEKSMNVAWDTTNLDLSKAGTYEIEGTVSRTVYEEPVVQFRADPYIIYNEQDKMYYFTGSYLEDEYPEGRGAYDSIIIRKASTINGLKDAEEVRIWWHDRNDLEAPGAYWAPEIHYFGGKWRVISMAGWGANRQGIFTCNGDMMNPDDWEFTGYIDLDEGDENHETQTSRLNSFDTTYFELNGTCYYVTPKDGLKIATFDPDHPTVLTSDTVTIAQADLAYEANFLIGRQDVEEGSSVLIHEDKIFIAYACATVDQHYATSILYADIDADLMNPSSWKKYPYPLLSTADLTKTVGSEGKESDYSGTFGSGHNSFTVDENGNPVIVYHARAWGEHWVEDGQFGLFDPGRHAYVNAVHFGADGFPIFNMTTEQQLSSKLETITLKVTVSDEEEKTELPFTDVNRDLQNDVTWYYDAVISMYAKNLMTGMNATYFGAYEEISRAQFAVILYRMEGEPEATYKNEFPDVKENESTKWYTSAVAWANANGLITGYTHNGHFGAADPITREQLATILYRYAKYKQYDLDKTAELVTFKDASNVSKFAKEAMEWAVGNSIITGKDKETRLDPQGTTKRSECAVVLYRFLQKFVENSK